MFGIGGTELVIIGIFALFLFGPDKIPEVIKTAKKALAMYTEARDQVTEVVNTQILTPEEREMLRDPLGIDKLKTSTQSILTPERLNLIQDKKLQNSGGSASTPATADQTVTASSSETDANSIWASLSGDGDGGSADNTKESSSAD